MVRSQWFVTVATIAFVLYFFWLITSGTFDPDFGSLRRNISPKFFWLQADAILHGRLNIDPSMFGGGSLDANGFRGECCYSGGECSGHFGVFPCVLRLPFVALLGSDNNGFTPAFLTASIGVSYWFSMDLVRRVLVERQPFMGQVQKSARRCGWSPRPFSLARRVCCSSLRSRSSTRSSSLGWLPVSASSPT